MATLETIKDIHDATEKISDVVEQLKKLVASNENNAATTNAATTNAPTKPSVTNDKEHLRGEPYDNPLKGPAYKQYFNGKSAANETGPGQAQRAMPREGTKPDTIYYENPSNH